MKPVLGRERAGEERHLADEARLQKLGEPGNAVGEHNAVDTILHVGVVVAHVIIAARCRILGHARELRHQKVADLLVAPLRRVLDVLGGAFRESRSRLRQDVFAGLIELFDLLREGARGRRLQRGGGLGGGLRGDSRRCTRRSCARRGRSRRAPGGGRWGLLGSRHRDLRNIGLRPGRCRRGGRRRGRLRCSRRRRGRFRCTRRRGRLLSERRMPCRDQCNCGSAEKQTNANWTFHYRPL